MEAEERPSKKRRISQDGAEESNGITNTAQTNGESDLLNSAEESQPSSGQGDHDLQSDVALANDRPATNGGIPEVASTKASLPPADGQVLSKNQQKKLRKQQEWEAKRDERRIVRKQKTVAKRARKRAEQRHLREQDDEQGVVVKLSNARKAVQLPVTILIDCDFDELMTDGERTSLAQQLTRSYSDNRNAPFRAHLTICSFRDKLRERFDNVLPHHKGWKGVRFLDCDYVQAAEQAKEWMIEEKGGSLDAAFSHLATEDHDAQIQLQANGEVVYLTSEAEETLTELKPYSTYIIGGLVDKNREKGICYKRATAHGTKTARLPIGDFMEMQSRKVLAVNHVNEIMVKWLECADWGEAFVKVIPKRKGGKLKDGVRVEGSNAQKPEETEMEGEDDDDDLPNTDDVEALRHDGTAD